MTFSLSLMLAVAMFVPSPASAMGTKLSRFSEGQIWEPPNAGTRRYYGAARDAVFSLTKEIESRSDAGILLSPKMPASETFESIDRFLAHADELHTILLVKYFLEKLPRPVAWNDHPEIRRFMEILRVRATGKAFHRSEIELFVTALKMLDMPESEVFARYYRMDSWNIRTDLERPRALPVFEVSPEGKSLGTQNFLTREELVLWIQSGPDTVAQFPAGEEGKGYTKEEFSERIRSHLRKIANGRKVTWKHEDEFVRRVVAKYFPRNVESLRIRDIKIVMILNDEVTLPVAARLDEALERSKLLGLKTVEVELTECGDYTRISPSYEWHSS